MIPGDFYTPPAWTDAYVNAAPTALIKDIPITTPEFTQAYWIGWRAWENVPQQYHVSRYVNGSFIDVTKPENVPVGFLVSDSGYSNPSLHRAILLTNNGEKWDKLTWPAYTEAPTNNSRLPNSLDVNTVVWTTIRLGFIGTAIVNDTVQFISGFTNISQNDLLNPGTITVTLTDPIGTQQINLADLADGQFAEYTSSGGYSYKIAIAMYTIDYYRDITKYGGWYGYQGIHPMMQIHNTDDKPHIEAITTPPYYDGELNFNWGSGKTGNGFFMDFSGGIGANCPCNNNGDLFGGLEGTIDFEEVVPNIYGVFIYGNFYCRCIGRNDVFIVGRIYTIDEIIKSITLLPRFRDIAGNSYTNSGFLYSKVDLETNEFLPEFVSGDTPDLLTDWQKLNGNINTNKVTTDDIPEYVPPTPEDEEQTDGIDWLPNRAFAVDSIDGFVTMYGLRGDQIGRFGQYLWAEFWSEDFLNSIGVIFNQNLSINPSEILNYIVSVRCYPFSLSGRAGASGIADTIYLGRGGEGISLNSGNDILKLTSYTEDIDGGLSVWEGGNTIPAYYNDFRDYEPCSKITVFVPFCGSLELPPSQVVGNRIHLRYSIDFSSGALQATISVEGKNNYIAGILNGTIGASVELSASNLGQVIQKIGGLAVNAAKSAALLSIGATEANAAMAYDDAGIDALLAETSSKGALTQGVISTAETITSVGDMSTGAPASFGTTAGFSAFQVTTPIIRVEYRHFEVPSNYAHVYGYACNKTVTLSDLEGKGYTVCSNVDLSGIPATQDELSAIESLLTSGVYF